MSSIGVAGKHGIGRIQRHDVASQNLFTRIRDQHAPVGFLELLNFLQTPDVKLTDDDGCTLLHAVTICKRWPLLEAFVLSGRWEELESARFPESAGDDQFNELTAEEIAEKLGSGLTAGCHWLSVRDMIRECTQWEESVSETMRAARRGDLKRLKVLVQQRHDAVDQLDLRQRDVLFWALTGGHLDVIDFLLDDGPGRVQNVSHQLLFANQTTVDHVMKRLVQTNPAHMIEKYINLADTYTDYDQWGIVYGRVTVMGEVAWKVYLLDRNRSKLSFERKITLDDVEVSATVKIEGKGTEVSDKNMEEIFGLKNQLMPNRKDRSALHHAVRVGNRNFVEALLTHGAQINQRDAWGMTPLHTAAVTGDVEIAQLLLNKGADRVLLDATLSTPQMVAEDNGHQRLAEEL